MRAGADQARLTAEQAKAAASGLKAMMPISDDRASRARPFLDYVLHELAEAGVTDVALVVAPDHDDARRWYRETAVPSRLRIEFVVQAEPLGTANAVLAGESWVGRSDCLVVNGDNLYPVEALRALAELGEPGLAAFRREALVREGNIAPERIGAFATIDVGPDGYLRGIVEKPGSGVAGRELVSMNCWRIDSRFFEVCRDVPRSVRGEFELPAAVMLGIERGLRWRVIIARGGVLDLSSRADVADVSGRLASREIRL